MTHRRPSLVARRRALTPHPALALARALPAALDPAAAAALLFLGAAGVCTLPGCSSSNPDSNTGAATGGDGSSDAGGDAPAPRQARAACDYKSPFTQQPECREFDAAGWTDAAITDACDAQQGTLTAPGACADAYALGTCVLGGATATPVTVFSYGEATLCDVGRLGCESFGGGTWSARGPCGGSDGGGSTGGGSTGGGGAPGVFVQPTLECRAPKAGEPAGRGPDGQVCTWQSIAASTEEGREYAEYASCDVVRTQRPYYAADPADGWDEADARMDDAAYRTEQRWVTAQVRASACSCCHSSRLAPEGASQWDLDAAGNWLNTMEDTGLALGANWIGSEALGAYPPADNNGFDRVRSGFPSTDPDRMVAFFVRELTHRGRTPRDFASVPPFGGPIHDQLVYRPARCAQGEGVKTGGRIEWKGGAARYVQVLEAGSKSPTVPPNLDLPVGTLWRVDVPPSGTPLQSGTVTYGTVPEGTSQRFPAIGAPAALAPGRDYYLYVSLDVGLPITRCVFTY